MSNSFFFKYHSLNTPSMESNSGWGHSRPSEPPHFGQFELEDSWFRDRPLRCRMFCSISGPHPVNRSASVATKNVCGHCQMPPGREEQNCPSTPLHCVEKHWARVSLFYTFPKCFCHTARTENTHHPPLCF